MKVFWKGSISCKNIHWHLEDEQIILENGLERQREEIWRTIQFQYPHSYDGDLLALKEYIVNDNELILNMNIIKFSRILTLEKKGVCLRPYGTIGMQMIVLTPSRNYILIGQRAHDSMYCPGFFSCPGGMLEAVDAKGTFEAACLREFHEEVKLELVNNLTLHSITSEINGTVGLVFIISCTTNEEPDLGVPVEGNEEWEKNQLQWYSMQNLERFSISNSLESVLFARENLGLF